MDSVIEVSHLTKAYGAKVAVEDVSFQVPAGEIFGMIGPNGAGKTTTIECVEGLRTPTCGEVRVLGLDVRRQRYELNQRIGVQLQECGLNQQMKVREAMELFASFYPSAVDGEALLEELGLAAERETFFRDLSGGQKQRLFVGLALIHEPEVVFLDEISTGIEPQARRGMWKLIRRRRDSGATIFLTSHYMEEVERLCDRVAILNRGRLIAVDPPHRLIEKLAADLRISFTVDRAFESEVLIGLEGVSGVESSEGRTVVYGRGDELVFAVTRTLEAGGWIARDLRTEQPSLDDVYLTLTGSAMSER